MSTIIQEKITDANQTIGRATFVSTSKLQQKQYANITADHCNANPSAALESVSTIRDPRQSQSRRCIVDTYRMCSASALKKSQNFPRFIYLKITTSSPDAHPIPEKTSHRHPPKSLRLLGLQPGLYPRQQGGVGLQHVLSEGLAVEGV